MRTPAGFLLPGEKLLHVVLDNMNGVRIIQFSSTQQHNQATEKKMKFQTGKTYTTRSTCNHDCIISVMIEKRTEKTVTCKVRGEKKTFRIKITYNGTESISPWGSYSMAPIITAQ